MIRNCSYCGASPICKDLNNIAEVLEPIRDSWNNVLYHTIKPGGRKPTKLDKYYLAAMCPYYFFDKKMLGNLKPGVDL
jgi:hypothetical protein